MYKFIITTQEMHKILSIIFGIWQRQQKTNMYMYYVCVQHTKGITSHHSLDKMFPCPQMPWVKDHPQGAHNLEVVQAKGKKKGESTPV